MITDAFPCCLLCWQAPELFSVNSKFTEKCDVYSYGVTLWELSTRRVPYEDHSLPMIQSLVAQGDRLSIPESVPGYMVALISDCWHQNPEKRPSFSVVVERLSKQ